MHQRETTHEEQCDRQHQRKPPYLFIHTLIITNLIADMRDEDCHPESHRDGEVLGGHAEVFLSHTMAAEKNMGAKEGGCRR